ncbi:hypothetical protein KR200_001431 [Drosophila serrata]|nr:hypothetical protein KR200_001431 [Drosophila serrata]
MFDFRKLSASKVSAGILRGIFLFSGYTGMVFFHFKEDHVVAINRSWWKEGLSLIIRIIPLGIHIYTYFLWIMRSEICVEKMLHFMRLLLSIPCYLAMIHIQLFHGPKVIKIINQYLEIVREVRMISIRIRIEFGGRREFFMTLLLLACQLEDIVYLFGLLHWMDNIISWAANIVVFISSNMILHISFIWYLSLGLLYKELNEYLRLEIRKQFEFLQNQPRYQPLYKQLRLKRKLRKIINIFRDIYNVVSSLQKITNIHLFLGLTQTILFLIVVSYKMIVHLNFCQFWVWFLFVKIMVYVLIITLAIQGAVDQFSYIREILLEIFFISDLKEWKKTVEIFIMHLNLCKLRVRLLGLFDVTNELFLVIVSGIFCYLVFIVQSVMQLQNV